MTDQLFKVELTGSFLERLKDIEVFLVQADAGFAFDDLLADIRTIVIPNLKRFPRMGRPYLANPPQSVEALTQLAALPAGAAKVEEGCGQKYVGDEADDCPQNLTILDST